MKFTTFECRSCQELFSVKRALEVEPQEIKECPVCYSAQTPILHSVRKVKGPVVSAGEVCE